MFSIVVPVFNSSESLPTLVKEIEEVMGRQNEPYEILLVDDCSEDDSWEVLLNIKGNKGHIRLFRLAKNFGQASSTLCGIHKSKGEMIITIDDDLQYPPAEIQKLIDYFKSNKYFIVFGVPKVRKHRLGHRLISSFIRVLINFFFLREFRKINYLCSFRIFYRKIYFQDNPSVSNIKNISVFRYLISPKFISQVSVEHSERIYNKSNYNLLLRIKHFIPALMIYAGFPLKYFFYFGILILFAALIPFILFMFGGIEHYKIYMELFLGISALVNIIILIFLAFISIYITHLFHISLGKPEYMVMEEA